MFKILLYKLLKFWEKKIYLEIKITVLKKNIKLYG